MFKCDYSCRYEILYCRRVLVWTRLPTAAVSDKFIWTFIPFSLTIWTSDFSLRIFFFFGLFLTQYWAVLTTSKTIKWYLPSITMAKLKQQLRFFSNHVYLLFFFFYNNCLACLHENWKFKKNSDRKFRFNNSNYRTGTAVVNEAKIILNILDWFLSIG